MPPLNEQALRRETFEGGRPIVLADGQPWYFPYPLVELCPVRLPSGGVGQESATNLGPEYDALLDDLQAAETAADEAAAIFGLAILLLGRNYDLTDEQFRSLLRYRLTPDRDEDDPMVLVANHARGLGPKPSPAGPGSAA